MNKKSSQSINQLWLKECNHLQRCAAVLDGPVKVEVACSFFLQNSPDLPEKEKEAILGWQALKKLNYLYHLYVLDKGCYIAIYC
jgi:hypothetical protein